MPPQIGSAREGCKPITQPASEGVQEINSAEVEKKSAEKPKDTPKNEEPVRRQASAKEANAKKHDIAKEGDYRRIDLDRKMNDKGQVIWGTKGDDNIHISNAPGLLGNLGMYEVDVNGKKQYATKTQLENTKIRTGAGKDMVVVDKNVTASVNVDGGSGNDVIIGGSGNDRLSGGMGNDVIIGREGNDRLRGGDGNDQIFGGKGKDQLFGDKGHDYLNGGKGIDKNKGGQGIDSVKFDWDDFLGKSKKE